jgi:hypothetical protein
MDENNISELMDNLFNWDIEDNDSLIEHIENMSSKDFSEAVVNAQKDKSYNSKINIPCNTDEDLVNTLLEKIWTLHNDLSGEEFKKFWDCIGFTNDVSVWGGEAWAPRVLPNGSVLFRNHHRVVGIDDITTGSLQITSSDLRSQLVEITEKIQNSEEYEEDNVFAFSLIHYDENGITWTNNIPESLSDFGNTLVLINRGLLDDLQNENDSQVDNSIIFDPIVYEAANNARSGHAIIKVFKDMSLVYSTHRASDDYDTIVEYFSYYLGEHFDENVVQDEISGDYNAINKRIREMREDLEYDIFYYNAFQDNQKVELRELIEEKLYSDFSRKKAQQVMTIPPMFGSKYNIPSSYYGEKPPFFSKAQEYDGNVFVLEENFSSFSSFNELDENIRNMIETISSEVDCTDVLISFSDNYTFKTEPSSWNTDEIHEHINELKEKLIELFNEEDDWEIGDEEHEQEFFENYGYDFHINMIFVTDHILSPYEAHKYGLKLSKLQESCPNLSVPYIGFQQGYDEGDIDTGNNLLFLTEDDIESINEELEEEDDFII